MIHLLITALANHRFHLKYSTFDDMNTRRLLLLSTAALALLFSACQQPSKNGKSADGKYRLVFNPKTGDKYQSTVLTDARVTATQKDKEINNNNKNEIGLIYEILPLKDSDRQFKITYDKIHIVSSDGNSEQEFSSANGANAFNPIEKALGSIIGQSIIVTLSPKGELKDVSGFNEVADKMIAGFGATDINVKKAVKEKIASFIGNGFLQETIKNTGLLPDSGVHVGDTWSGTQEQTQILSFKASTSYVLSSVSNNIAKVISGSTIDNASVPKEIIGQNVDVKLDGEQNGTYEIDLGTGMVMKQKTNTSIEGEAGVLGQKVPMRIHITKEVVLKKL